MWWSLRGKCQYCQIRMRLTQFICPLTITSHGKITWLSKLKHLVYFVHYKKLGGDLTILYMYPYKFEMQDIKPLLNHTEKGKTITSDWKGKLGKFKWEIRLKYLTMRVINLWKTVGDAHFSIPCYLQIKTEISWEETVSLFPDLLWASLSNQSPYRNSQVKLNVPQPQHWTRKDNIPFRIDDLCASSCISLVWTFSEPDLVIVQVAELYSALLWTGAASPWVLCDIFVTTI